MNTTLLNIIAFALLGGAGSAQAVSVIVPGTSDPWLAGMPNGTTASSGDIAPNQSPVQVTGIAIASGVIYSFTTTGTVGNDPGYPSYPGDGDPLNISPHVDGAQNGIGSMTGPVNSLVGVFLNNNQPNLGVAPSALDFSTAASRDFSSLSPLLQQPFFIGDGRTSGNAVQQFVAPAGATRLFLGTFDGAGWYNNIGSFTVVVVPEPGAGAMGLACLASSWIYLRRTAKR